MEDNKELSNEQNRAITRGIKLGRTLQKEHPEIAVMYGDYSQGKISEMLDIQSNYAVSDSVAITGVRHAIGGHENSFGIEGYVGLIPDEGERKKLEEWHKVAGGKKSGQKTYEQGVGVHGRTPEQHSEDSRNGYKNGLANRTPEQHSEDSRNGYKNGLANRTPEQLSEDGRNGAIARGQTLWTDDEKEFAYMLSQKQEYQHPKGSNNPGKPNNELIALELNMEFHNCDEVRSTPAVGVRLSKHRKSLDDMVA